MVHQLIITSDILYLITLYTTKCCVVGIYLRLTPQKTHNRASWATLLLCTLWVVPAILILSVNCGLNRPWKGTGGQCENLVCRIPLLSYGKASRKTEYQMTDTDGGLSA